MAHPVLMQTIVESRHETIHNIAADIRAEKTLEDGKPSLAQGITNRLLAYLQQQKSS